MRKADYEEIAQTLHLAEVRFITVGGIAVNEHGYGRNTFHVDLVVRLTPDAVKRAFAALASIGYFPRVPITAEEFSAPETRRRFAGSSCACGFSADAFRNEESRWAAKGSGGY